MPDKPTPEELWHMALTGDRDWRRDREVLRFIPAKRRCKNCHAPSDGIGGLLMRFIGRGPFQRNPRFCDY